MFKRDKTELDTFFLSSYKEKEALIDIHFQEVDNEYLFPKLSTLGNAYEVCNVITK